MTNANLRQLADRLVELGMLSEEKSTEVLDWVRGHGTPDDDENTPLSVPDLVSYLPEFGVAVSIHVDDVDFVDEYYSSVFEDEITAVTGGAVVITDVTLLNLEDDYEYLYFLRNGEPMWWSMDHESDDYVDTLSVAENFGDFAPGGDDPRRFFQHRPEDTIGVDQVYVFATPQQARTLRDEFGIDFFGLDYEPPRVEDRTEAEGFATEWESGMEERLRRWRQEFLPGDFPFDFTLGSLEALERLVLDTFADKAEFEAASDGRFVTGAVGYLGETLIRTGSCRWEYRTGAAVHDRVPLIVSDTPNAFIAVIDPSYRLQRIADHRGFGGLSQAAGELRDSSQRYSEALRALESDGEEIEDED